MSDVIHQLATHTFYNPQFQARIKGRHLLVHFFRAEAGPDGALGELAARLAPRAQVAAVEVGTEPLLALNLGGSPTSPAPYVIVLDGLAVRRLQDALSGEAIVEAMLPPGT